MNSKIFLVGLLIICFFPLWSSIKDYQSAKVQYLVLNELNSGSRVKRENYELLKNLDKTYPNISVTTLPLYSVEALYDIMFQDYKSALYNSIRARNINPYLMFNESIMSDIYKKMGLKDSAQFYARKAFENIPGNGKHFMQYLNLLIENDNIPDIINEYFKSEFKNQPSFKKVFLAAIVGKEINSRRIDSLVKTLLYDENEELKILSYYHLNGIENTKKAIEISKNAFIKFNEKKYSEAVLLYEQANQLNPYDISNLENLALSQLNAQQFENASQNFQKIINSDFINKGKSYYGLGLVNLKIGDTINACIDFYEAYKLGNKDSFELYSKLCF